MHCSLKIKCDPSRDILQLHVALQLSAAATSLATRVTGIVQCLQFSILQPSASPQGPVPQVLNVYLLPALRMSNLYSV